MRNVLSPISETRMVPVCVVNISELARMEGTATWRPDLATVAPRQRIWAVVSTHL